MTPQDNLMVVARVAKGSEERLRSLLRSMTVASQPGTADPRNPLIPFRRLAGLHFARFVLLDDRTSADVKEYGLQPSEYPLSLAFLADFDGPRDSFVAELIAEAGPGLEQLFGCCGLAAGDDLASWLEEHCVDAAAAYVHWIGRTMQQIREDAAVRNALCTWIRGEGAAAIAGLAPAEVRKSLATHVRAEVKAGRLTLSSPGGTPIGWRIANAFDFWKGIAIAVLAFLLALALLPLTILVLAVYAIVLRYHETRDAEITPRADEDRRELLAAIEDHDVANQFTAFGSIKPGAFRRFQLKATLAAIGWAARHVYGRGFLLRIRTIHFARWVYLDGGRRLFFASNYDGSLESYMDEFINKVGFGLNLVFSNAIGYPRTRWLVAGGASEEQKFKRYIRRHQLPTEVWYNAHPGLTAVDLARNARIREGLERRSMSDYETRRWLELL